MKSIGRRGIGIHGIVRIDLIRRKEKHKVICVKIDSVWSVYLSEKLI